MALPQPQVTANLKLVMFCPLCQCATDVGTRNVFLDDTLKEDCTRLSAYLSRLSLEERLRCIGLLIIRAVRSLGDKKLLLSISPPFIADIIEEARKMLDSSKGCRACTDPPERRAYHLPRLLIALSRSWKMIPSSLRLHGIILEDRDPINGGGYADIFRALYLGQRVALKRLRTFSAVQKTEKEENAFRREALVSWFLSNPNVQPFLGIDQDTFRSPNMLCIVTPWQRNGNILDCLRLLKGLELPILLDPWIKQIVEGLHYLHNHHIIHGDLRAGNILIDDHYIPKLADFGLSILYDATSATLGSRTAQTGSLRFTSPEFLMNEKARPSFSSDIYAFGCVCIELFTLRSPFADVASDAQVIAMVMRGTSPCRPPEAEDSLERFWDIVEQCWNTEPHLRPSSGTLATILPLRVSALCTSKMKHHLHTEWEAPSSKLPVNHDTYILDSCLLNLLDLNALTSIHGLMTCLSSIHCPLDVLQFIEEILGKHEDNPVGGSYGCCQKFFREDGHKGHGANDLMVGIRWFQHMHGSMSIHANGDLGSPPGEAQQSHSLQEFPLVSSQSSQRPLPDQSTPYTNEPLHPTPNTHPTETQHRPKAQVPQGGYPPPLPYYRLVPKDLSYKIPHNFGLGSGVQPLRLTQNPHLDSPEASVQESMHKGKEPQSARVDVGVVVQGKLRTPQLYGRQHPIASVKTEAEYPGQRLRTGIGMQRSKGSTRLHGENAAQKRVQGFVGLRSRSASSVSGQYEVIVKSLRTGNTPHAKTFSSEVHDGGNAVGIGMRARQESGEKMQIKIGGFDGGRTSGTMVPEEQSQRVERGPQRNLAYPRRGSMGSAFYWFGSSSSINEDTN